MELGDLLGNVLREQHAERVQKAVIIWTPTRIAQRWALSPTVRAPPPVRIVRTVPLGPRKSKMKALLRLHLTHTKFRRDIV